MPTISHKQLLDVANTTPGGTASWSMIWAATRVLLAAGWKYAGSSDGTVNKTKDPTQDRWLNSPGTIGTLASSGSTANIYTAERGRALVTGLSGITSADKGRFLKFLAGPNTNIYQIEEIVSATSVKVDARTFSVTQDLVNRNYEIRNPLTETYKAALTSTTGWWCGIGPHTIKIPITSAVSGRFVSGERIIQEGNDFEGELRDVVWNVSSSTGYLTVFGQVRGTGVGVYGLSNGQKIVGQSTGSYVNQSGTAKEFRAEVVFYKANNDLNGSIYYGMFDISTDTRFSDLVLSAGCTASVAPGAGGTGNAFPNYAWVAWGIASSTVASFPSWANCAVTEANAGNAFAVCADAIEERGYSADGSFVAATLIRNGFSYGIQAFQLLEKGDYGDLAPWVSYTPHSADIMYPLSSSITGSTSVSPDISARLEATTSITYNGSDQNFIRGWVRRGFGDSYDRVALFDYSILTQLLQNDAIYAVPITSGEIFGTGRGVSTLGADNTANRMLSVHHDDQTPVLLPLGVGFYRTSSLPSEVSYGTIHRTHKGQFRWLKIVDNGVTNTLLHYGTFLQLKSAVTNLAAGPFAGVAPDIGSVSRLYLTSSSLSTITASSEIAYNIPYTYYKVDGTWPDYASSIPADPGSTNWLSILNTHPKTSYRSLTPFNGRAPNGAGSVTLYTSWVPTAGGTTSCARFTSPPLAAQTISGTVKGQMRAGSSSANAYLAARLYVIQKDGTIRGVLRELLTQSDTSGGTALVVTSTNRKIFRNGTLSSVSCQTGDRLVLELGIRLTSAATTLLTVTYGQTSDLPENETTTTTTLNSWIEFSSPIIFDFTAVSQQ